MRNKYRKHKRQEGIILYVNTTGSGFLGHCPVCPGSDRNSGLTPSKPLKTISKAMELLREAKPLDGRKRFGDAIIEVMPRLED